jgi:hypothetical protein
MFVTSRRVCEETFNKTVVDQDKHWDSVVVSCFCEELVAEAGDNSGTHGKVNVRC